MITKRTLCWVDKRVKIKKYNLRADVMVPTPREIVEKALKHLGHPPKLVAIVAKMIHSITQAEAFVFTLLDYDQAKKKKDTVTSRDLLEQILDIYQELPADKSDFQSRKNTFLAQLPFENNQDREKFNRQIESLIKYLQGHPQLFEDRKQPKLSTRRSRF